LHGFIGRSGRLSENDRLTTGGLFILGVIVLGVIIGSTGSAPGR